MVSVLWRIRTLFDSFCGAMGLGAVIPVLVVLCGDHNCTCSCIVITGGRTEYRFRIRFSNTLFPRALHVAVITSSVISIHIIVMNCDPLFRKNFEISMRHPSIAFGDFMTSLSYTM